MILGAVAVPDPFCVLVLEGLGEGVVAAGFVDCLLAVVVPGTGCFLAAAEDMMRYCIDGDAGSEDAVDVCSVWLCDWLSSACCVGDKNRLRIGNVEGFWAMQ